MHVKIDYEKLHEGLLNRTLSLSDYTCLKNLISFRLERKYSNVVAMATYVGKTKEDLVQEIILRIVYYAPRFNPSEARFSTYLFRIIDSRACSWFTNLKMQLNKKRVKFNSETVEYFYPEESGRSKSEAQERIRALIKIAKLSPGQAEALELYLEGLTTTGAARKLGIKKQAVSDRLMNAIKKLKRVAQV